MASTTTRPGFAVWLEAARPRTLPAAVVPVLVGTSAALRPVGELIWWRALTALAVSLSLQVAVNYANDYFDARAGVDTAERVGPRRAVASGLVTPASMRRAMLVALAVAAVGGLVLAAVIGWELLLVGVAAIAATVAYSGGQRPYASAGLGEVFVFVFFGLVATVGSQYVQDAVVAPVAVVAAVPVGLVVTAILVVNNLRDIATDRATGKRTLAVRLGEDRTRLLYQWLVWSPFVLQLVVAVMLFSPWPLLVLLAVPLAGRASGLVGSAPRADVVEVPTDPARARGPVLVRALESTGHLHLAWGVLLALWLGLGAV